VSYWAGEAVDRNADFDSDCVGYPSDSKVPALWKTFPGRFYDSKRVGLSNRGHDEGIFLKQGRELLSPDQKRDLIEYLKTL
jgi:hypothetical protein